MPQPPTPPLPLPLDVATLSEAEINERVLARVRKMTPQEIFAFSVACGIHRPDGRLTPEYGGEPDPQR